LQALLSFIGQFLPLFLQLCGVGSVANALVQIAAAKIDNRILAYVFMLLMSRIIREDNSGNSFASAVGRWAGF